MTRGQRTIAALVTAALLLAAPTEAQAPQPGRYTLTATNYGPIKLDTATGQTWILSPATGPGVAGKLTWAPMPDYAALIGGSR